MTTSLDNTGQILPDSFTILEKYYSFGKRFTTYWETKIPKRSSRSTTRSPVQLQNLYSPLPIHNAVGY